MSRALALGLFLAAYGGVLAVMLAPRGLLAEPPHRHAVEGTLRSLAP